jgi:hypothetical protein
MLLNIFPIIVHILTYARSDDPIRSDNGDKKIKGEHEKIFPKPKCQERKK